MNYYNEIKRELISNEINKKIKDYSKNKYELEKYYVVGRLLYEVGSRYGENIIGRYSNRLMKEVGKKYDKSTLFKIRKFYVVFSNEKVAPLVPQLSWSHCVLLLPLKDIKKINYYIEQTSKRNLSKRQLQQIIKSKEYERLPDDTKNKLINDKSSNIVDFIKNPILIKNDNYDIVTEKVLQRLILEDISSFLKELGEGFTFIENEYAIKLGDRFNYVDILLYNIKYRCYVVVELKISELKKEHIGQIQVYMNYIDENVKTIEENKTVGIIICKYDNEYIIKYCSDKRIISRIYELV